jgi:hypothetical protein
MSGIRGSKRFTESQEDIRRQKKLRDDYPEYYNWETANVKELMKGKVIHDYETFLISHPDTIIVNSDKKELTDYKIGKNYKILVELSNFNRNVALFQTLWSGYGFYCKIISMLGVVIGSAGEWKYRFLNRNNDSTPIFALTSITIILLRSQTNIEKKDRRVIGLQELKLPMYTDEAATWKSGEGEEKQNALHYSLIQEALYNGNVDSDSILEKEGADINKHLNEYNYGPKSTTIDTPGSPLCTSNSYDCVIHGGYKERNVKKFKKLRKFKKFGKSKNTKKNIKLKNSNKRKTNKK